MNSFIILALIIFNVFFFIRADRMDRLKLTAVNDSYHVAQLYITIRNYAPPSELDPVTDLDTRNRLCEGIMSTAYFSIQGIEPIYYDAVRRTTNMAEILRYLFLFNHVYRIHAESTHPYIHAMFRLQDNVLHSSMEVREHVLLCLARNRLSGDILPYYISKEYNLVRGSLSSYKTGRFVFSHYRKELPLVILAEKPAKAYVSPDYNVELHYIRIRRDNKPVNFFIHDPLCELTIFRGLLDNQYERLCVAVLGSSYFEGVELYPEKPRNEICAYREVSFQTENANRVTADASYHEMMIACPAVFTRNIYYISRAYNSNRLFLYKENFSDGKIYLENLSTNVIIRDAGNRPHIRRRYSESTVV